MSAREVIAQTLFEFSGNGQGVDDMLAEIANAQTETIIDALTAAGYRILGPGELDGGTLKRAAKAQCSGCATDVPINDEGYHQQGSFTFPCHASAIRALTPSSMEGKE